MIKDSMINLMVADMNRAVKFYNETMGFELGGRWGDHYAIVNAPGMKIGIHPELKPSDNTNTNLSIGFQVDSLEQAIADATAKGIQCTRKEDEAMMFGFFSDPDGTPLYFAQSKW